MQRVVARRAGPCGQTGPRAATTRLELCIRCQEPVFLQVVGEDCIQVVAGFHHGRHDAGCANKSSEVMPYRDSCRTTRCLEDSPIKNQPMRYALDDLVPGLQA